MAIIKDSCSPEERKLWEEFWSSHTFFPERVNEEARVLFQLIQIVWDGNGSDVTISPYLLHNLAACATVILQYNRDDTIPLDQLEHDAILCRVWNGFRMTLDKGILEGRTYSVEGKTFFRTLEIPAWYVEYILRG